MQGLEDRIVELLGEGVPQAAVATTVGCDPSYISQLMAKEEVAGKVAALRVARAGEMVAHDNNISSLEKTALEKVGRLLAAQTDIMKVTRVFEVLNKARRACDSGIANNAAQPSTTVVLNLPPTAHVQFQLTADNQVVSVENTSMVPMASSEVARRMREQKANRLLESTVAKQLIPMVSPRTRSIADSL